MRLNVPFAQKLVSNYAQNHWTIINGACPSLHENPSFPNVQDSRSVWFCLADLKNFIAEFENSGNDNTLGVRVYFGEYSADLIASDQQDPLGTGLHTLLMVPTLLGADGLNHDFDPATGSSDFSQSNTMCCLNHGSMAPPPFTAAGLKAVNIGQDFMLFCDGNAQ